MRTSPKGVQFIACREGLVTVAYKDGKYNAIGFGSNGPGVLATDTITPEAAVMRLRSDIESREPPLAKLIKGYVCPHMWDALLSLGYNAGMRSLAESDIITAVNDGQYQTAGDAILEYHASSIGLKRRRSKERAIFLNAEYGEIDKIPCWTADPRTTKPTWIPFPEVAS